VERRWRNIAINLAVYWKHTGKRNKESPEKDGKTNFTFM
jgi:hypothetical protein